VVDAAAPVLIEGVACLNEGVFEASGQVRLV
jgi:hypothetical protein